MAVKRELGYEYKTPGFFLWDCFLAVDALVPNAYAIPIKNLGIYKAFRKSQCSDLPLLHAQRPWAGRNSVQSGFPSLPYLL